ncbi:MAG TPA: GWxTD domain-containing protein [Gemmatimonadales bacterium]|nr:GWxTD domain-containing protein [Gemmatimonadales bacterium]
MSARATLLALAAAALALLAPGARPAAAQSVPDRAALDRWRDSLATASDSTALLALERRMIAAAKADRDNPVRHLRLGFLALRLGDLGGKRHYDDAASEFQWAIDLRPQWPYAWLGMGLAELGVGDSQVSVVAGLQTMFGKDALARSAAAFAKSAEVDPAFVQGLSELATTALRQRVNIRLNVALDALRRAAHTAAGTNPEVLLARGRVERMAGDIDSALVAFQGYLQRAPEAKKGIASLELARTYFVAGSLDGVPLYYAGAAADDSATVAGYRDDLALIAADSDLAAFDRARGAERVAFLRRFWGGRDAVSLHDPGARLREHYRRLFYARRNFALVSTHRHYDITERYRSGSPDFDDRGIIYIRHGEPTLRATSPAVNGLEPNESWRYERPDGDLLFHFVAREDVQDFKLVESLFDVLSFSNAVYLRQQGGLDRSPGALTLLQSRDGLSPIYGRIQGAGSVGTGQMLDQERRQGQRSIEQGTRSDSYELHFPQPLRAQTNVLAVGAENGQPLLQLTYAIPGQDLRPETMTDRGPVYAVRVRFVALDPRGNVVATLDTTRRVLAPQPVPPTEHLVGRIALPVSATGTLGYRLAVQQGESTGVVLPRDSVRVEGAAPTAADAPALGLSDLVLGSLRVPVIWHRDAADTVWFNPLRTFRRDDHMRLYYEVHGLTPGQPYTTQLVVKKGNNAEAFRKLFGGSAVISLKFADQAQRPETPVEREISLDRLKPGLYVLGIAITDAQGRTDWRQQAFQVVEEKK